MDRREAAERWLTKLSVIDPDFREAMAGWTEVLLTMSEGCPDKDRLEEAMKIQIVLLRETPYIRRE